MHTFNNPNRAFKSALILGLMVGLLAVASLAFGDTFKGAVQQTEAGMTLVTADNTVYGLTGQGLEAFVGKNVVVDGAVADDGTGRIIITAATVTEIEPMTAAPEDTEAGPAADTETKSQ